MDNRYTLPALPYDYAALEPHYSARLLELHHDKHHAAYVAGANTTLEKLAEARDKEDFAAIKESFGSVANLKGQLNEAALNVQGSGWGTLAWEPLAKRLVTEQVYDHQGNIGNGTVPLLVLDMWEHAYYLQYQNVKGEWVKAFWKIVNWEDVRQRLEKVRTLDLAL